MADRVDTQSDAVPQGEIEEITDRIDLLDLPESRDRSDEELGEILSSFEGQLLELNRALRYEANAKIGAIRKECRETCRAVASLNSELDVVVKGDS